MKKILLLIITLTINTSFLYSQYYISESSNVSFYSYAPLEDIKSSSTSLKSIVNASTGEFIFKIAMNTFEFENDLMEEHFNENYVESEKFPFAYYKGKVDFMQIINQKAEQKYDIVGNLEIHGVTKERTIPVTITNENKKIIINSKFKIKLEDHNIEIPKAVFKNIAEEVEVTIVITLVPKS